MAQTRSIKGPGGSNEYSNPPDRSSRMGQSALSQEDATGVEPAGTAPGASYNRNPPKVGRKITRISGPGMDSNPQNYRGT